jgi:integrase/recombinase XerD
MALKKRKRVTKIQSADKVFPELSLDNAVDMVVAGKRTEGMRDRTLRDYVKMWGYFANWLLEHYEVEYISELTPEMFRNYINYMKYDKPRYGGHKYIQEDQGIGLSDTTININLRCLRSMLNYLVREELLEVSPMAKIKMLRQDTDDLTNCFTDDEVKAILQQPDLKDFVGYRDFVAINLLLDSGLRIQELLNLRMGDIDFQTRFITVQKEVSKNRKARLVPISAYSVKLLLQLAEENKRHFKTDRIFLSSYGEPLGANHFTKRLKYHAKNACVEGKKVTAHVYRHTWAKNMISNGCDAFTLQKIGGWADMRTMRKYIQMDVKEMRRSHDDYSPLTKLKRGHR